MHIKILSLQYPTDMAIPVINDRRDFRQNELASSANFVIAALSTQLFSKKKQKFDFEKFCPKFQEARPKVLSVSFQEGL